MTSEEMIDKRLSDLKDFKNKLMDDYYSNYSFVKHSCHDPFGYGRLVQVNEEIKFLKEVKRLEAALNSAVVDI